MRKPFLELNPEHLTLELITEDNGEEIMKNLYSSDELRSVLDNPILDTYSKESFMNYILTIFELSTVSELLSFAWYRNQRSSILNSYKESFKNQCTTCILLEFNNLYYSYYISHTKEVTFLRRFRLDPDNNVFIPFQKKKK